MAIPFEDPIPITIPGDPAVPSVSSAPNIPSNSLNPWESKWSSGLGYPSMSDRLSIGLNNWVTPRFFIRCIWDEKHFKARKLQKQDGCYYMKERTDRDVYIGALQIKEKIIVNPQPDGTFEVLLCKVLFNREPEETVIAIPYINFVRRNILPYLNKFRRNPDCPDRYIILAFCHELLEGDDAKFLQLPNGSGWHESAGKLIYASSELVISQLKQYYSSDILERKLQKTVNTLEKAARELANLLPACWQYKLLLAIRLASLLLFFFYKEGVIPDQFYIIDSQDNYQASTAIALLKNRACDSIAVTSITECSTSLQHELNLSNDCMSVFRDTSFVEHRKQRNNGIDVIVRDLLHCKGIEEPRRHFSAVVTDNAGNYSSELPAFFIQLNGCPYINNIQILQQVLGRFDYALIRHLKLSDPKENLFTRAFAKSAMVSFTIKNSEYYCSERMIRTALVILREYRLMSDDEFSETLHYLKHAHHKESDSSYSICNDFQKVLSRYICFGKLKLVNQYGPPYFQPEKRMCFLDSNYINITAETIDNSILILLKTTKKRNKLLRALQNCNILYANNNYKRNVEAEVAPGDIESFGVYSIPISFLTPQARAKVNAIAFSEFLFEKSILPETFLPIIQFNNSHAAGRMISDTTDEAESIYLSGQTRSGKTCMATNQAVIRLEAGQQVVVIDQTNAFCKEELQKFLPEAVISNQFVFWSINEKGLPVNVLSLEHCKNTRDKKKRLESILMVAASLSGDVQQSTLQRRLSGIVKGIEDGNIHWFGDILKCFDEADPNQAEIRARLETIAGDLEDLPSTAQSWGDLPQDKIIVISVGADGIRKSGRLFDILLAHLYAYKQHNRPKRMTVVLDELVDLNLESSGPINTILRKGGKLHLSMLIAAQHFSAEDDRLGRLIGNCSIKVFFRPMDNNLTAIAKHYKIDKSQLASLEQGECIAVGPFYSQNRKRNCQTIICGKTFPVSNFIKKPEKCQGLEPVTAENSGGDENA